MIRGAHLTPPLERMVYGVPFGEALAEQVAKGVNGDSSHAVYVLAAGTLRAVGVKAHQLDTIAAESMHDRWVHTNPRKISGAAPVRQILDMVW